METRVEKTLERLKKKYNCAQSVACTYCDLVGMDEKTMFRFTEAFGAGMGCAEGVCGAVSGACALAGLKASSGNLANPAGMRDSYRLSREMIRRFQEKNGTIICKELKGKETGKMIRSCEGCIQDAAEIVEEVLFEDWFIGV